MLAVVMAGLFYVQTWLWQDHIHVEHYVST